MTPSWCDACVGICAPGPLSEVSDVTSKLQQSLTEARRVVVLVKGRDIFGRVGETARCWEAQIRGVLELNFEVTTHPEK